MLTGSGPSGIPSMRLVASTDRHIGIEVSGDGRQAIVLLCRVSRKVTDDKTIGMSPAISAEAQCLERHGQEACEKAACCVPQNEHRSMQTKAARVNREARVVATRKC